MPEVCVVGATGQVGRLVMEQALDKGYAVRALARRPDAVPAREGLEVHRVDVLDRDSLVAPLKGADVVLSCVGTPTGSKERTVVVGTANLVDVMKEVGAKRIAIISSIGVGDSAAQLRRSGGILVGPLVAWILRNVFLELGAAEAELRGSGLGWVSVRAPQLTHKPGTGRWAVRGPEGKVARYLSRADLAGFMVSLVEDTSWDGRAVSLSAK
jgi:uncharacterized protein YbjT (DUF2867 family)